MRFFREYVNEVPAAEGSVPDHLPGQNPFLTKVADRHDCRKKPRGLAPETMYPEFRLKMVLKQQ